MMPLLKAIMMLGCVHRERCSSIRFEPWINRRKGQVEIVLRISPFLVNPLNLDNIKLL
jgi:hypothetical protein